MSCVFRGSFCGTLDARADLRERTASSRPRSSRADFDSPAHPPGDKRSQTRCVRPWGARFRRRRQRIRRWSLAGRQRGIRRPRRPRRPRRLRRRTSRHRRRCVTSDPHASSLAPRARANPTRTRPRRSVYLGFVVAGFFRPGGGGAPHSFAHPRRHPSSHLPQRSASSSTRARARPCASSPTPRCVPRAGNPRARRSPVRTTDGAVPVASDRAGKGRWSRQPATASAPAVSLPLHLPPESNPS